MKTANQFIADYKHEAKDTLLELLTDSIPAIAIRQAQESAELFLSGNYPQNDVGYIADICQALYAFGFRNQDMKGSLRQYAEYYKAGKISREDAVLSVQGWQIELSNAKKRFV